MDLRNCMSSFFVGYKRIWLKIHSFVVYAVFYDMNMDYGIKEQFYRDMPRCLEVGQEDDFK